MKRKALKAAFPYTIPIFAGFWFLGLAYGIYMNSAGFLFVYPMLMSFLIFGGSLEFVAVEMLLSPFVPLQVFIMTLLIQARHLFYGISMLDKFKGMGWKKFYLIFGMCDETRYQLCNDINVCGDFPRPMVKRRQSHILACRNSIVCSMSFLLRSGLIYDSYHDTYSIITHTFEEKNGHSTRKSGGITMTLLQQIITIGLCIAGTMLTRFLPFIIFNENAKTPAFVQYIGKYLPAAVFGMLVVYCLRNINILAGSHGLPEAISIIVTVVLHLWRRNMLISIAGGTICYMVLIHFVFL